MLVVIVQNGDVHDVDENKKRNGCKDGVVVVGGNVLLLFFRKGSSSRGGTGDEVCRLRYQSRVCDI